MSKRIPDQIFFTCKRHGTPLTRGTTWDRRTMPSLWQAACGPLAVFLLSFVAGKAFHLYQKYPWFDIPSHVLGGMAFGFFFCVAAAHAQKHVGYIPRAVQLVLSFGLTLTVAVCWEFFEYLSDLLLGSQLNHGVGDTLMDLFFGMAGSLLALLGLAWRWRLLRKRQ